MIIALLDIIRNSYITNLFFFLMKEEKINDVYIYDSDRKNFSNRIKKLLYDVEEELYNIIVHKKYDIHKNLQDIMNKFIFMQKDIIFELESDKKEYNEDLYVVYRKAREADNIFENIVCLQMAMDNIVLNIDSKTYFKKVR